MRRGYFVFATNLSAIAVLAALTIERLGRMTDAGTPTIQKVTSEVAQLLFPVLFGHLLLLLYLITPLIPPG